ncbi:bestrophin family ion channel [Escherichia coli]
MGQLMIASRSLLREVNDIAGFGKCKGVCPVAIASPYCLRMTLRKQPQAEVLAHYLKTEDLQPVLASMSPANRILLIMGSGWRFSAAMGSFQISCLLASTIRLNDISSVLAGCERIAYTPIPFAYTLILHRTVYLFCIMPPFALVVDLHYMTAFISVLISYFYFAGLSGGRTGDLLGTEIVIYHCMPSATLLKLTC